MNQHEGSDVLNSLHDELDVETSCIKETHPVKHLEPHNEDHESANDALSLQRWPINIEKRQRQHESNYKILEQVEEVEYVR